MDLFKQFPSSSLSLDEQFASFFQLAEEKAISSLDLVTLSSTQLAKSSGRSSVIVKKVQNILEKEVASTLQIEKITLNSLDNEVYKHFTTGDEKIDDLLHGGISVGAITEVSGASATGKSHLLLQLAITVQLPREFGGLGFQLSDDMISMTQTASMNKYQLAKVIYISTENCIETRRLSQIRDNFQTLMETNGINQRYWPTTDNIYQITCNDLETQDHILFYQVPNLVKSQSVKLIIVDSIAHHLRVELQTKDNQSLKKTWSYIYKFTNFLKKLASDYQLAVVVSNQVSDRPMTKIQGTEPALSYDYQLGWMSGWDNETILRRQFYDDAAEYEGDRSMDHSSFMSNGNTDSKQIPALGMIWQNRVDHRIILSKYNQPIWDELLKTIRVVEENEEDEDQDISKNFEVKRRVWYDDEFANFQIWKGGIRKE